MGREGREVGEACEAALARAVGRKGGGGRVRRRSLTCAWPSAAARELGAAGAWAHPSLEAALAALQVPPCPALHPCPFSCHALLRCHLCNEV